MKHRDRILFAIATILLVAAELVAQPHCKSDPQECAEKIRKQLAHQRSLGVTMVETRWGTVIESVLPESSAARAGLRPDDRFIVINGHDCVGARPQEVKRLLMEGGKQEGAWITIVVARLGEFKRIRAKLDYMTDEEIETIVRRHIETAHSDAQTGKKTESTSAQAQRRDQ